MSHHAKVVVRVIFSIDIEVEAHGQDLALAELASGARKTAARQVDAALSESGIKLDKGVPVQASARRVSATLDLDYTNNRGRSRGRPRGQETA